MLIKMSAVKKTIKELKVRSSKEFIETLDRHVDTVVRKGVQKALNDGRKTLNSTDIEQ